MKGRLGSRWVVLESGGDKGARRPLQNENIKQLPCSLASTHISQGFQTTTEDIACGRLTVTLRIITKPIFHLSYLCSLKMGGWRGRWGAPIEVASLLNLWVTFIW